MVGRIGLWKFGICLIGNAGIHGLGVVWCHGVFALDVDNFVVSGVVWGGLGRDEEVLSKRFAIRILIWRCRWGDRGILSRDLSNCGLGVGFPQNGVLSGWEFLRKVLRFLFPSSVIIINWFGMRKTSNRRRCSPDTVLRLWSRHLVKYGSCGLRGLGKRGNGGGSFKTQTGNLVDGSRGVVEESTNEEYLDGS